MKILSENSVFKRLPIEMQTYQLLIFDAIRITFEMIEHDYCSLEKKLFDLSQKDSKKENVSQVFNYAWGIIDNTSRLIRLFKKLPSESNYKVLENIIHVNTFRNTHQHLDERIDESMLENKSPFYGIISWYHKNLKTNQLTPKTLVSGIAYGFEINFKIPNVSQSINEINDIHLQTVDKNKMIITSLSKLMIDLRTICVTNEDKLTTFFKEQNWNLCDWSKRMDIMIQLKNPKKLSPCIVSWAKFALNVENKTKPKNKTKCTEKYWRKVIDTILAKPEFEKYNSNKASAYQKYEFVKKK